MQSRKNFLKNLSILSAAVAFQPGACVNGQSNNKVLNVALMGLGGYANRVADAMKDCKKAKLVGVISGTPSKIKDWQMRFNIPEKNCYNYENFDTIKNNRDIDVVYVITPNGLHHNHVIRAARAGKHVICEKPMANTADEAREMVEACTKAGVKLLVGYRMHFEANTLEIVRMRNSGEMGKPLFFQGLSGFRIGDPTQWRLNKQLAGGGALMDIGVYSINGARYMVGEDPAWVTAQETKTDPVKFKVGVDETITFQFGFPSGATSSCLSTYAMNNLDKFYLNCENGYAELWPSTGYGPIKGSTHKGPLQLPHVTHQTVQMDEMADIILNGKKPVIPVDGIEGFKDNVIIDAIYKAAKTGGKVQLDYTL